MLIQNENDSTRCIYQYYTEMKGQWENRRSMNFDCHWKSLDVKKATHIHHLDALDSSVGEAFVPE
jgi:hypothetical protein